MHKRDFELLAKVMQGTYPLNDTHAAATVQWAFTVAQLADNLASTNDRFDRARFIGACQPGANVKARKHA